ncbi:MAG TPA: hypothetical protein DEP72_08320 [Clostridiales bacterium]|nr:MAG: hypothetical protein A2Y18_03340 [Clostridiales bacterium GWD2_32_19]HCC08142.1 hypothetical protein [Clostridiales bacterium]
MRLLHKRRGFMMNNRKRTGYKPKLSLVKEENHEYLVKDKYGYCIYDGTGKLLFEFTSDFYIVEQCYQKGSGNPSDRDLYYKCYNINQSLNFKLDDKMRALLGLCDEKVRNISVRNDLFITKYKNLEHIFDDDGKITGLGIYVKDAREICWKFGKLIDEKNFKAIHNESEKLTEYQRFWTERMLNNLCPSINSNIAEVSEPERTNVVLMSEYQKTEQNVNVEGEVGCTDLEIYMSGPNQKGAEIMQFTGCGVNETVDDPFEF